MGQLVVQQCFLVLTNKLAELTLESAVGNSLDVCEQVHFEGVALLKGLSTLRVGKVELDGDGPEKVLPLVTALPGSPTLSHMCGFSVL